MITPATKVQPFSISFISFFIFSKSKTFLPAWFVINYVSSNDIGIPRGLGASPHETMAKVGKISTLLPNIVFNNKFFLIIIIPFLIS